MNRSRMVLEVDTPTDLSIVLFFRFLGARVVEGNMIGVVGCKCRFCINLDILRMRKVSTLVPSRIETLLGREYRLIGSGSGPASRDEKWSVSAGKQESGYNVGPRNARM